MVYLQEDAKYWDMGAEYDLFLLLSIQSTFCSHVELSFERKDRILFLSPAEGREI